VPNFKEWLNRRLVLRLLIVVILSIVISYFFSFTHEFLIPITALFVMITPVGNIFSEGLKRFVLMVLLVTLVSCVFSSKHLLYLRLCDVLIGYVLGMVVAMFVFPRKPDALFRAAVLPILIAYENYFSAIIDHVMGKHPVDIETHKIKLEQQLESFPLWVYRRSFDVGLQIGHRYFLGKMQQVASILFSIHYASRTLPEKKTLKKIRAPLQGAVTRMQVLFKALATVFELKKLSDGVEDCQSELYELENAYQALIPEGVDLANMPKDFVRFLCVDLWVARFAECVD